MPRPGGTFVLNNHLERKAVSEVPIDPEFSPVPVPDPIIPGWLFWCLVGIILIVVGVIYWLHHRKIDRHLEEFHQDPDHPKWHTPESREWQRQYLKGKEEQ